MTAEQLKQQPANCFHGLQDDQKQAISEEMQQSLSPEQQKALGVQQQSSVQYQKFRDLNVDSETQEHENMPDYCDPEALQNLPEEQKENLRQSLADEHGFSTLSYEQQRALGNPYAYDTGATQLVKSYTLGGSGSSTQYIPSLREQYQQQAADLRENRWPSLDGKGENYFNSLQQLQTQLGYYPELDDPEKIQTDAMKVMETLPPSFVDEIQQHGMTAEQYCMLTNGDVYHVDPPELQNEENSEEEPSEENDSLTGQNSDELPEAQEPDERREQQNESGLENESEPENESELQDWENDYLRSLNEPEARQSAEAEEQKEHDLQQEPENRTEENKAAEDDYLKSLSSPTAEQAKEPELQNGESDYLSSLRDTEPQQSSEAEDVSHSSEENSPNNENRHDQDYSVQY